MTTSRLDALKIDRAPEATHRGRGALVLLLLLVVSAAAAAAWWFWLRGPAPVPVRTVLVREAPGGTVATVLNASGYVIARRQATVSSKLTALVVEVLIEEGMVVEQGQVLARLDDVNIRRMHELSEAQLRVARTALKETQALQREAEANYQRQQQLVDRELGSEVDLDRARAVAESLTARLERMDADVAVAERQVAIYAQQMDDAIIRAPFAGVIVAKNAQPGEMISPISAGGGFTRTGIGTLVDMSSLEIEIDVNEAYINRVTPGQKATATLDAWPDWQIPCRVIAIIPTADRQRATVEVRVAFDETDARILPDMGVKVAFQDEAMNAAPGAVASSPGVLVPRTALHETGTRTLAWVSTDGHAERRAVATGGERGDDMLVTAGLKRGERVILAAPDDLAEGDLLEEMQE